ncbi:unnamed protein product, partial [Gulo gulo]
ARASPTQITLPRHRTPGAASPSARDPQRAGRPHGTQHLLLLADGAVACHPLHPPHVDGTVSLDLLQLLRGENHRDPRDRDIRPAEGHGSRTPRVGCGWSLPRPRLPPT